MALLLHLLEADWQSRLRVFKLGIELSRLMLAQRRNRSFLDLTILIWVILVMALWLCMLELSRFFQGLFLILFLSKFRRTHISNYFSMERRLIRVNKAVIWDFYRCFHSRLLSKTLQS